MADDTDDSVRYVLKIRDLTPSTAPMSRVAQYIRELSKLMGSEQSVHLDRIYEASLNLESTVDPQADAKVHSRLNNPGSTAESKKAYDAIHRFLYEDKTSAIVSRDGARVFHLDGTEYLPEENEVYPAEYCTIRGELILIGGRDNSVPFDLIEQGTGNKIHGNIDKSLAKSLAKYLFGLVEVSGVGSWEYNPIKSMWKLTNFDVQEFTAVDVHNEFEAIDTLRASSDPNGIDPLETLKKIRSDD